MCAGRLSCPVTLRNDGTVGVANVTVQGDANNCTQPYLDAGRTLDCVMWRDLTANDFANSTFVLSADRLVGSLKQEYQPLDSSYNGKSIVVGNPTKQVGVLSVTAAANTTIVGAAGDLVEYTVTLVSTTIYRHNCLICDLILRFSLARCWARPGPRCEQTCVYNFVSVVYCAGQHRHSHTGGCGCGFIDPSSADQDTVMWGQQHQCYSALHCGKQVCCVHRALQFQPRRV